MPEYYQGNSVLGARPIRSAAAPAQPNLLLAGLIMLLCAGLVGLMAWLRPAGGGANLSSSVVLVMALFDDSTVVPSTGWVSSSGVVTTRQAAYPRGVSTPPAELRVFLRAGSAAQQQTTASVASKGSGPSDDPLAGNYAVLKLAGDALLPPLDPATEPPGEGDAVRVRGYDASQQTPVLQTIEGRIAKVAADDQGLSGFALEAPLPKSFDGAPVTDPEGRVLGMYVHGVTRDGSGAWVLPVGALGGGK